MKIFRLIKYNTQKPAEFMKFTRFFITNSESGNKNGGAAGNKTDIEKELDAIRIKREKEQSNLNNQRMKSPKDNYEQSSHSVAGDTYDHTSSYYDGTQYKRPSEKSDVYGQSRFGSQTTGNQAESLQSSDRQTERLNDKLAQSDLDQASKYYEAVNFVGSFTLSNNFGKPEIDQSTPTDYGRTGATSNSSNSVNLSSGKGSTTGQLDQINETNGFEQSGLGSNAGKSSNETIEKTNAISYQNKFETETKEVAGKDAYQNYASTNNNLESDNTYGVSASRSSGGKVETGSSDRK